MVWAVTSSLSSGDAAGPAYLSCSVCLLTAWGCPAILLWPQQHGQYGWDNCGQFSFALNQNAHSWEKARKEDFGVGGGTAARGWSPQSCSEPCWHSPVGAAESPHAPILGDVSPPAHLLPQCYVCRCSNCWAPQPMLFVMLQEKSKYFSSPTRAAQRERLSWKQDCFLLAPLCLPYVYHSVCKNSLHPLRTQPPTEFCTFRTTSPHTQLAHSQIPAQLQLQTQLDLTGHLGDCSNTGSSRPYIFYFEEPCLPRRTWLWGRYVCTSSRN